MKSFIRKAYILLVITILLSCSNDDNVTENDSLSLIGSWESNCESFFDLSFPLLEIENNRLFILNEDEQGFRTEQEVGYEVTEASLILDFGSSARNIRFQIENDTLTLTNERGETADFFRPNIPINVENWIDDVNILSQGASPINEAADISWADLIIVPNGFTSNQITLIGPESFEVVNTFTTDNISFAVEIDLLLGLFFIADDDFSEIDIIDLGVSGNPIEFITDYNSSLTGLAATESAQIYVSHNSGRTLSLFDNSRFETLFSIDTEVILRGLDYQEGRLYVCANGNIYECNVNATDGLQVMNSYTLPEGISANGIAFDGDTFWVHALTDDGMQLIKTDLEP